MMHLAAFYQSVDPGAKLTQINAVPDQSLYTTGKELRVPSGMANLLAEAALSAATTPSYAQVQSPTLRSLANQDINPVQTAAKFATQAGWQNHSGNPRSLSVAEPVNFAIDATGGAAAANYGLVVLGDGPIKPTTGNIISVRGTAAITLAAGSWVNGAVSFNSVLPAGTYQVVGLWAEGANLVAARLVFPGANFRPGVPANDAITANFFPEFRNGMSGVLGEFDTNQPPTLDCLGATDTAQNLIFDLIKTK